MIALLQRLVLRNVKLTSNLDEVTPGYEGSTSSIPSPVSVFLQFRWKCGQAKSDFQRLSVQTSYLVSWQWAPHWGCWSKLSQQLNQAEQVKPYFVFFSKIHPQNHCHSLCDAGIEGIEGNCNLLEDNSSTRHSPMPTKFHLEKRNRWHLICGHILNAKATK